MRYLATGGGTAVFLLFLMVLLFLCVGPALGQDSPPASTESFFESTFLSGGISTWPSILMLVAVVTSTVAGMLDARRPRAWPRWPALVCGLGEAGFLLALVTTFGGMREAMQVIARVGAAISPADLASGLANVLAKLVLGAAVALAGLAGGALLRWWRHRLAGNVAEEFA